MMKKITLMSCIIALFFLSLSTAQNQPTSRTCGTESLMERLLQDPNFAKDFARRQAKFQRELNKIQSLKANGTYQRQATLYIPVAVHYPEANESDRACLEALAQNQVDILNKDYTATADEITGSASSDWPAATSHYPGVNLGPVDMKFCIATMNHPTVSPAIANGSPAVTIGSQSGTYSNTDNNTVWAGYMNFVVKNIGAGLLGYAPLGGSPAAGAAVVQNLGAFGSGAGCPNSNVVPQANFDLGRTVTHELGHFYNLDHTFNGGCTGAGDSVADTPAQANSSSGCPAPGSINGCVSGEKVLSPNFMDYTNDACMYMFTAGQADRMNAYFATVQNEWKQNVLSCQSPDFTITTTTTNSTATVCAPANATFDFTFGTSNGYNTNTALSVSAGLPANATATFSPISMNAAGNFNLTIGNTANITPGNYTLTVSAAGTTTKTVDVVLSVQSAAPTVPNLNSPANNAQNQPLSTTLNWAAITNAATYTVQTATDAGFTANLTTNTVNTNSYTASGLIQNTDYYWRVKAINGCGESTNSSVFQFKTASIQCNTFNDNTTVNIPNATANGTEAAPGIATINIPTGNNISITDVNVTINITYPYLTDLRVELEHPDGTKVNLADHLTDNNGPGAGSNYTNTVFDDASGTALTAGTAPFTGTFSPDTPLSVLNGKQSAGDWKLNVYDNWTADTGTINSWSIEICGSQVLSVEDHLFESSFNLWPNPSNGEFTISFTNSKKENVSIQLFDIRGRKIFNQIISNTESLFNQNFNFNHLESALYILKVKKGATEINKRVLIK